MIRKTPTQRLEWIGRRSEFSTARKLLADLLRQYEIFLTVTNASEDAIIDRFLDKAKSQKLMSDAYKFGDLVFEVLNRVGSDTKFFRLLVV
jgi:hypothetical protein